MMESLAGEIVAVDVSEACGETGVAPLTAGACACLWCGQQMPDGRRRGSARRFCRPEHRTAFHSAARRYVNHAVTDGRLTVADLHGPGKACTPQSGAISVGAAGGVAKTAPRAPRAPRAKIRVLWAEPPSEHDQPMVQEAA